MHGHAHPGEDLRQWDRPWPPLMRAERSPEATGGEERLLAWMRNRPPRGLGRRLHRLRAAFDAHSDGVDLAGVDIRATRVGTLPAEWVLATGSDPDRRLLYLHGGAFTVGSARSHRAITSALARAAGVAVLALDYRLAPEARRPAMLADSHAGWHHLLTHGPHGPAAPAQVFVAGDSAGGCLALELLAWVRDHGVRPPDAAIALSPLTDSLFDSPSLRGNRRSDHMLGKAMQPLLALPRPLRAAAVGWAGRLRAGDPRASPLRGNLAGLPPLLIQASTTELLRDDAVRFANRARAAGSPVELQLWPGLMHVWPVFAPDLPESAEAVAAMARHLGSRPGGAPSDAHEPPQRGA